MDEWESKKIIGVTLQHQNTELLLKLLGTPFQVEGGYIGFTLSIHLSVCPSMNGSISALYIPQYLSDPFHFHINQLWKVHHMLSFVFWLQSLDVCQFFYFM